MKYIISFSFVLLIMNQNLLAQGSKPIRVKAGDDIMEVLTPEYLYRYPQFIQGTVSFKNGGKSGARLNYNLLIAEMQFIDPKKDTLSIANEETIDYITVAKDTFYYDKGYIEIIAGNSAITLGRKQVIRMDKQKLGGYDQASGSSSVTSFNTLSMDTKSTKLSIREDVILSKAALYFIGDTYNHFLPASKKTLMKVLPTHQKEVENYLKDNSVNYNNEEDLRKLFAFLLTL